MGTEKRDRQKANKAARQAEEAAAEARQRRIRFIRNAVILTIVIIVVGFALAGCGSSSGSEGASSDGETATSASDSGDDAAAVSYGTGACAPAAGTDQPVIDFDAAPKRCIDPAKTYTATVVTSEGTVVVELDTERTPVTTNNFVNLARSGYYDGTSLFRTEATSGIIQGGSPHTQDARDPGPGYTIPDEGLPFTSDDYGPGTLAMARSSAPNSAGGQFFFLANEGGRYLGDPSQQGAGTYVVFGKVKEGLDVLETIAGLEDGSGSATPSKPVSITSITIAES